MSRGDSLPQSAAEWLAHADDSDATAFNHSY